MAAYGQHPAAQGAWVVDTISGAPGFNMAANGQHPAAHGAWVVDPISGAPGFHFSPGQVPIPRQKGICAVCNLPVLDDQARSKNQQGKYVHSLCAAVGGAQVVTKVYSPHQKGICAVCGMPVLADQARNKNQWGAYVHARCQPELNGVTAVVKGICAVCRLPVFKDQVRTKNQQGAYVHGLCGQQMPHNIGIGYCPFCTMPILDGQAYKHQHCRSGR